MILHILVYLKYILDSGSILDLSPQISKPLFKPTVVDGLNLCDHNLTFRIGRLDKRKMKSNADINVNDLPMLRFLGSAFVVLPWKPNPMSSQNSL